MKILLTGSAGRLARVLAPRLCDHPEIERVRGVDLAPVGFQHPKLETHRLDVRSPELARFMAGCDTVIHAAFVVMRGSLGHRRRDRALVREINVNGSANVFETAARAGVKHIVHISSAAAYGAWLDNPERISEDQPLRGIPDFAYAEDKAAVEAWLDVFETRNTPIRVIRFRPHVILGPHAQPLLKALLRAPFYPHLPRPEPLLQCVHEDDVARATITALSSNARGAFNLATEPPMTFRDMHRRLHRLAIPLPLGMAVPMHRLAIPLPLGMAVPMHRWAWRFTGVVGEPGWLDAMGHPLVLNCSRAERELRWTPVHGTEECLRSI
jgi:UDP-glucose 4-epimerase